MDDKGDEQGVSDLAYLLWLVVFYLVLVNGITWLVHVL